RRLLRQRVQVIQDAVGQVVGAEVFRQLLDHGLDVRCAQAVELDARRLQCLAQRGRVLAVQGGYEQDARADDLGVRQGAGILRGECPGEDVLAALLRPRVPQLVAQLRDLHQQVEQGPQRGGL